MMVSFRQENVPVPAGITAQSVGECFTDLLDDAQKCSDDVKDKMDAVLEGIKVPTEDEKKAARDNFKQMRKAKRGGRRGGRKNRKDNRKNRQRRNRRNRRQGGQDGDNEGEGSTTAEFE